jgi:ribonuclease T2
MITMTCRDGRVMEARICLDRDLSFRRCGADIRRDCASEDALLDPVR